MNLKLKNLRLKRRTKEVMDRYELAGEIAKTVKSSIEPCEDIKYLAKTLDVLWEQSRTEDGNEFKKIILKIKDLEL